MKRKDGFSGERALVLPTSIIKEMEKNPLSAQLHITDIGYYPNARFHYRERQEPITQYVLIYCVEGSGWFRLNGEHFPVSKTSSSSFPQVFPTAMPPTTATRGRSTGSISKAIWQDFTPKASPIRRTSAPT